MRQRLVEIGDDVGDALHPDREAHNVGTGTGGGLLRLGELAMGRRGRVEDERAGVADIGEVREELAALDDPDAGLVAAPDTEGEGRAGALGQVFPRQRVVWAGLEPG